MLWSGSSPLTVVRDGMWGFLLFAGVAWLAIAWSVLRLEPADLANVAGPVILFAAVTEAVRALAGTRTWWLNAGMAALFAATGLLMLRDDGSSWTAPAALIGWYLLVRGAADIAVSMLTRESDRIWGLLAVVGVAEAGLGFFSASSFVRTPELVVLVLGGAALTRGVADLVAALRLREASAAARAGRLLELTPERAVGVAGYSAGLTDFESGPRRRRLPHRYGHRRSCRRRGRPAASTMRCCGRPPISTRCWRWPASPARRCRVRRRRRRPRSRSRCRTRRRVRSGRLPGRRRWLPRSDRGMRRTMRRCRCWTRRRGLPSRRRRAWTTPRSSRTAGAWIDRPTAPPPPCTGPRLRLSPAPLVAGPAERPVAGPGSRPGGALFAPETTTRASPTRDRRPARLPATAGCDGHAKPSQPRHRRGRTRNEAAGRDGRPKRPWLRRRRGGAGPPGPRWRCAGRPR